MQASHDDPGERVLLAIADGGSVRVDDQAAGWINPQGETVPAETVHRDGHADVGQESAEGRRVLRVVKARREVHPEPRGLDDGVVGGAAQVSGPAGYLIRAPVLGSAVQGHEPHRGAKVTLFFDALDMEELP